MKDFILQNHHADSEYSWAICRVAEAKFGVDLPRVKTCLNSQKVRSGHYWRDSPQAFLETEGASELERHFAKVLSVFFP